MDYILDLYINSILAYDRKTNLISTIFDILALSDLFNEIDH